MLPVVLLAVCIGAAFASPSISPRTPSTSNYTTGSMARLLVTSGSGRINSVDFDGKEFTFKSQLDLPAGVPSWAIFKEPGHLYTVNESDSIVHSLTYDRQADKFGKVIDNKSS